MSVAGVDQSSKRTGGGSPGHVVAAVRASRAVVGGLVAGVEVVVGGAGSRDVTRGLDDVGDQSRRVDDSRLLMLALQVKLAAFVSAQFLQPALTVLLYQYLHDDRRSTYLIRQTFYRLALRPQVGPVRIPD